MITLLSLWIYVCLAGSLAACIARARRYAAAPLHLRWELYPVPHEEAKRAAYGGSRHEETDWWTRSAKSNPIGGLAAMSAEILTLKGVREFNLGLWFVTYPFHGGLYLLALTGVLVTAGAPLHPVYAVSGLAGAVLTVLGAMGLLLRRTLDARLRNYTTPGDIFNLLFFIVTAGTMLFAYTTQPPDSPGVSALLRGVLTFDTSLQPTAAQTAALALAAALICYIPLTHMSHFIGKYFMYHQVRWDDAPNRGEKSVQAKIAEYLTYRPTWSAPHVGADGKATWVDIATKNPAAGAKK